jgi:hypothetical protein
VEEDIMDKLSAFVMEITSGIIGGIIAGIVLIFFGYIVDKPKLAVVFPAWKRRKWVGEFSDSKKKKKKRILIHGDHYIFYGITIQNQKRWLPRPSAEITSTTMKIWDSKGEVIAGERQCRWWTVDHASIDPLFIGSKADIDERKRKNIGSGAEESIVLFYHQEAPSSFYRFSVASDILNFPNLDDELRGPMPYYAFIKIKGSKVDENIHLCINTEDDGKCLAITLLSSFLFDIKK